MSLQRAIDRRGILRGGAAAAAGAVTAPIAGDWWFGPQRAVASTAPLPFVDHYRTNLSANLGADSNAAIRALSGMSRIWHTGETWDTGVPLLSEVLRANMRYCVDRTTNLTPEEAMRAFIIDRQHQSYAVIAGLGPLADLYRGGARAVTSIVTAPDATPETTISDTVPTGAPAGSAVGAGSPDSELGAVVTLVNTLRGAFASSNPSKYVFQYPRPWRMTDDSQVVDTGVVDSLGYPVYRSSVRVAPQLLRQRSTKPAEDGGFPSGHTNALHLAALALAYAIPERFQELVACAYDLSDGRIAAGMHSPIDVIGGRILATALAAATLYDPASAAVKAQARAQAAEYFQRVTGTDATRLYQFAHSTGGGSGSSADLYADWGTNRAALAQRLTYVLPRSAERSPMVVPKGAEVLLETRLPYLSAEQRREVLRTTAVPAGYLLLDGTEHWGRINLFAAADGFGSFDRDVRVDMDAAAGGFHAADRWRNDLSGRGGLTKAGTGTLTLTGNNTYSGGTRVQAGCLLVTSAQGLGTGQVQVQDGVLHAACPRGALRIGGRYAQQAGGTLTVTLPEPEPTSGRDGRAAGRQPAIVVDGRVTLDRNSRLEIVVDPQRDLRAGSAIPVIRARGWHGTFRSIAVRGTAGSVTGVRAEPIYHSSGLSVRFHLA